MKKLSAALPLAALIAAACSDNGTSPSQPGVYQTPMSAASALAGTNMHVMSLRGAPQGGGVSTQATGIQYHGGPILVQTKVVAVYWANGTIYSGGPAAGTTGTGAQDASLVGFFLQNLGGSGYFNINTTYFDQVAGGHTVQNSVTYSQFWADNTNVPPANGSTVSDPTIQAEIIKGFNNGNLTYDPQTIYSVFTTGNTNLGGGFGTQYCAYHSNFTFNGQLVIYSVQPYVAQFLSACSNSTAAPNGDVPADAVINVLAHEIEESTTDYALNAWFDASGQENADKCAWNFGATYNNGTGVANMKIGTKDFLIQQNWVNSGNGGCLQSFGGTGGNQPPVAAFTSSCTASHLCTFNGTSSTDDVGVVSWIFKFGAGGKGGSKTGTIVTRQYEKAGTYIVALTVADAGGLTNTLTKNVKVR